MPVFIVYTETVEDGSFDPVYWMFEYFYLLSSSFDCHCSPMLT